MVLERMKAIKLLLHLMCLAPLGWAWLHLVQGGFGADPVKELIHFGGRTTLQLLILTLSVSPLARGLHKPELIRVRRLLGLWCFAWACGHVTAYLLLELAGDGWLLLSEILRRPNLLLGAMAWLILLSLALTSNRWSQRRLGRAWQRLHWGVYAVAILAPWHYLWSVKSLSPEPWIYAGLLAGLLLWRVWRRWRRLNPAPCAAGPAGRR
ncbi:protein-methionine-sulfoxide reductase heme-binding subunit MsrQ [Pseudaeromonas paramecii]|uniref:Protein-methionine-sulfoxide reductase heme-binding subunit MsrQ n=2 Tax=Pseudaeromonas paramecii TaxID=2138166 RepID=A0ABP8PWF6_9GAMM